MTKTAVMLSFCAILIINVNASAAYWKLGPGNLVQAAPYGQTGQVIIGQGLNQPWYWAAAQGIGFLPTVNMTPEQDSNQLSAESIAAAGRWSIHFDFTRAISRFRFTTPLCTSIDLTAGPLIIQYSTPDLEQPVEIFRYSSEAPDYQIDGSISPYTLPWIQLTKPTERLTIKFIFNGYIGDMQFHHDTPDGGILEYQTALLPLEQMAELQLIPNAARLANTYYIQTPPRLILSLGPDPDLNLKPQLQIYDIGRQRPAGQCTLTRVGQNWFADLPQLNTGTYDAVLQLDQITNDITMTRFSLIHPPRELTWPQMHNSPFGMNYNTVDGRFRESADLDGPAISQAIGLHQVRGGFGSWVGTCPDPNVYRLDYDIQLRTNDFYTHGLVPHNNLAWTPSWANQGKSIHHPPLPQFLPRYREFAQKLAAFTKGYAQPHFEIWNEPNCEPYGSFRGTLDEFIAMCHAAADGVHQANPQAKMILGSTGGCCAGFIARLLQAGLSEKFDIIDIHPYRHSAQGPEDGLLADINRLKRVIELYGDNQDIIFSEVGWPTHIEKHAMYEPTTYRQQANFFARTLLISLAADIKRIHFHMLQDWGLDPQEAEHHFGIITTDGWPKPSLAALSTTHRHLEHTQFIGTTTQPPYHFAWLWNTPWIPDAKLITVWADTQMITNQPQWLDLPAKPIHAEDLYGAAPDTARLRDNNGTWQVLPDADPIFIYIPDNAAQNVAIQPLPNRLRPRIVRHTTVQPLNANINIDGNLAEWGQLKDQIDTQRARGAGSMGYAGIEEGYAQDRSSTTQFAIRYDSQGLYFAVDVLDDTPMQNNRSDWWIWAGDCVRLYLGTVDSEQYPFMSDDHVQFGLAPVTNTDGPPQAINIGEKTPDGILSGDQIPGAQLAAQQTQNGWTMEAFIPFSYLRKTPRPGDTWSFDIEAAGHVWNGGPDNWNNPLRWGTVTFE